MATDAPTTDAPKTDRRKVLASLGALSTRELVEAVLASQLPPPVRRATVFAILDLTNPAAEIARDAGVSRQAVQKILRGPGGRRSRPIETAAAAFVSTALGVTIPVARFFPEFTY